MSGTMIPSASRSSRGQWQKWLRIAVVTLLPLAMIALLITAFVSQEDAGSRVPALIVNEDELIEQVNDAGETEYVLAGRLLVTELTGDNGGLDWGLANREQAEKALRDGSAQVVLYIPSDFSDAVLSLGSDEPRQARIQIVTDDSHGYLSGAVVTSVSDSLTQLFGRQLTQQYIVGVLGGITDFGEALDEAADGATKLADGAKDAAKGAKTFADGVRQYTNGVGSLNSGLQELRKQTKGLGAAGTLVKTYGSTVTGLAGGLQDLINAYDAHYVDGDAVVAQLRTMQGQLAQLDAAGEQAMAGLGAGLPGLEKGVQQIASGSQQLASNGSALARGASDLADGVKKLASGSGELADGLREGAGQAPAPLTDDELEDRAETITSPITATVERQYEISQAGVALLAFLLPFALWLGMLAWFAIRRPIGRRQLAGSSSSGRLLWHGLSRALLVAAAQAILAVLVMRFVVNVPWQHVPALTLVALIAAIAIAAVHMLLSVAFGRAGTVVSLLLAVVQLTAAGGLFPIQLVAAPFEAISGLVPISHAVAAAQSVLAGAPLGQWLAPLVVLVGMTFLAAVLGLAVLAARRGAVATGITPREWLTGRGAQPAVARR